MKIEEAIKLLKNMDFSITTIMNREVASSIALNIAIEALEKQIPKEPIWEGDGYVYGEMVYDIWRCPSCDAVYEEDEIHDYCPDCGQKILWEEK